MAKPAAMSHYLNKQKHKYMELKMNRVSNLSDARYAASYGFEYISFCLNPDSPDYIELSKAAEIAAWIDGPAYVAELGTINTDQLAEIRAKLAFNYIESDSEQTIQLAVEAGIPVFVHESNYSWFMENSRLHASSIYAACIGQQSSWNESVVAVNEHHPDMRIAVDFQRVQLHPNAQICEFECGQEEKPGFRDFEAFDQALAQFNRLDV